MKLRELEFILYNIQEYCIIIINIIYNWNGNIMDLLPLSSESALRHQRCDVHDSNSEKSINFVITSNYVFTFESVVPTSTVIKNVTEYEYPINDTTLFKFILESHNTKYSINNRFRVTLRSYFRYFFPVIADCLTFYIINGFLVALAFLIRN